MAAGAMARPPKVVRAIMVRRYGSISMNSMGTASRLTPKVVAWAKPKRRGNARTPIGFQRPKIRAARRRSA
jgi:hypothetical protein